MKSLIYFKVVFILVLACNSAYSQKYTEQQKDSILNSYITLPGSDIQIVPPAYFKPFIKEGKFGLMHEGAASSISIEEIKGVPFTVLSQGVTKENLESQNVKLLAREEIKTLQGKDAHIYLVSFTVKSTDGKQDSEYERIMLFTGDYNRTIWINANYPVIARSILFNVLKASLLSVKFE